MRILTTMALTGALTGAVLLGANSPAAAQSRTIQGESITVTVEVVAIEQASRTMTVKDDKGIFETVQAPPG